MNKGQFYLHFDTMPKGTSQEIRHNRHTGAYYKDSTLASTEAKFLAALRPYAPSKPSDKPIRLFVFFYFDIKSPKKLWGKPKPTRPDTDNYLKLFKDCMTKTGFWKDDAQVVDEHTKKFYAERATIYVYWEEIDND